MLAKLSTLPMRERDAERLVAAAALADRGRVRSTRKIAKNATTVSRPSASSQAKRTMAIPAKCRWSLTNSATEMLGRS